jgi:hypothetical protein
MFHTVLPKGFSGGLVTWRLVILHYVARILGLHVKVEGFPYGTCRNLCNDRDPVMGGLGWVAYADGRREIVRV